MADFERTVMEHYQITSLTPEVWPQEKDNSDASEGEEDSNDKKAKLNRRKSRYQALERAVSTRSSVVPGSEKTANGIGNLVQRDEPDPLGTTDSVVRTLKQYGVPLQDDPRLRNRFLLSSTTFSPALFLSQMHASADTNQLLMGLDALSQSIDQKSASLKVLVESNFERFVRAKATIDNVYKEMKYRGAEPPAPPTARARAHSRHTSRNSFRAGSGNINLTAPLTPQPPDPRKKNALTKESEYGVTGIKTPLLDVSAKAEDVWGPALGGQEREENLKTVANSLGRFGEYVETSAAIADSIKRKDHESLIEEYSKARRFADEARRIAQQLGSTPPSDSQLYQILLAARMWHDVEEQISAFKRTVWRRLSALHNVSKCDGPGQPQDQHMELISLLLELGAEDNPIYFWLLSRYDNLKGKIQSYADRAKVEIEVLRRRLSSSERPAPRAIGSYLRALGRQSIDSRPTNYDSGNIIELWEKMLMFLSTLLSPQGILAEVVEFWQTVQGFLDGKIQRSLPTGYNGESLVHHQLSEDWASNLQKGTVELVEMVREHVFIFFAGPPPEDISLLFSPMPLSPKTPMSTSLGGALSPTAYRDPRFNLDPNNLPPPSPKRGEAWEKFAFWPPWSNSVSAVHYLSKMLALIGSGASEMAAIAPVGLGDTQELELLKTLVNVSRERCVVALCAAWNKDAETIKHVEDWNRAPEDRDVTKMPACFSAFEGTLLAGMQKILYIPEASAKAGAEDIVTAPPTKLLQMVRSQYVTTLYKALSGMVENAERSIKKSDDEWTTDPEVLGATSAANSRVTSLRMSSGTSSISVGSGTINAGDRNVRMLLTLSNLQRLRSDLVPSLNTQFENAFSVKLTDETKTIRDVLGQIDARLFQSYTRPSIETLRGIIRAGVTAADWAPANGAKPREARPYVYEVLLTLVLVHSQVSTTASSLTTQVLSYLLEQTSRELLEAFKTRPRYDLSTLLQAALDVEFAAQTLQHYTTQRAKDLQNQIYQEIESRSDRDAVLNMQNELPELRSLLKRLRDASKNEFACFKKVKRSNSAETERKDSV
ncbi:hypothetical protein PoMZ_02170 [Pyricularia oryzae]|uniref:Exocyst complex component SEC5 n=1 Tax=Pyricularia oryzae TaxID=318829 RepID=A0A4P7N8F5_PYROR|nr:hypothetical protein PoMZ_02170 [Pyricularia oryzae]